MDLKIQHHNCKGQNSQTRTLRRNENYILDYNKMKIQIIKTRWNHKKQLRKNVVKMNV